MTGTELPGGWVSISDGLVDAVGAAGSEPPAGRVVSARGCLVTPGLVNVHHHMYQNLTRAFAPVSEHGFGNWARDLSKMWSRLDEEASFVSTWVGLAELALGGCTLTTDDLYVHPCPGLIDAQIKAAGEVGLRFDPCRGTIALSQDQGAPFADEIVQDEDTILADTERLITTYHDRSPNAMVRIVCGPTAADTASPALFRASAELAEKYDVQMTTHLSQHRESRSGRCGALGSTRSTGSTTSAGQAHAPGLPTASSSTRHRSAASRNGVSVSPTARRRTRSERERSHRFPRCSSRVSESGWPSTAAGASTRRCGSRHGPRSARPHSPRADGDGRARRTRAGDHGLGRLLGREGQNGVLTPGACGDVVAWPLEGIYFSGAWTDPVEAWLRCGPTAPATR